MPKVTWQKRAGGKLRAFETPEEGHRQNGASEGMEGERQIKSGDKADKVAEMGWGRSRRVLPGILGNLGIREVELYPKGSGNHWSGKQGNDRIKFAL